MTSLRHLRSSTANKRPDPTAMVDGQLAMNYDIASPGLFFKDDNGTLIKVGPVHVGTTAPNVSPAAGGTAGNSIGEQWLDTTSGVYVLKVWDGSAWRSESGTFVDVSGDTMTGALTMANQQAVRFSETTANGSNYIALQADAALASNKTITLPDTTGTVVTTGDTGTVTSTMIANGTILNADVNASAAIAGTKVSPDFGSQTIVTTGIFSSAAGTAAAPSIAFTGDTNTGIYSPGADQVAVSTGGTGRLFVAASGNVGIGTTSPAQLLDISAASSSARIISTTGTNLAFLNFNNTAGNAYVGLESSTGGNFSPGTGAYSLCLAHQGAYPICFATSSTERARIDSSGRLLIGTSSGTALLSVSGAYGTNEVINAANTTSGNAAGIGSSLQTAANNTSSYHFTGSTLAVGNWYLYGNGTSSWSSDERLKTNIQTTRDGYLEDVQKLRVVKYQWKNGTDQTELGLIAQEVEEIFPGLVQDDLKPVSPDDPTLYKQLKGSVLPIILLKALQEAVAKIETLQGMVAVNNITIDEQQNQLSTLAARLTALESA
jgi:hypothetical protein